MIYLHDQADKVISLVKQGGTQLQTEEFPNPRQTHARRFQFPTDPNHLSLGEHLIYTNQVAIAENQMSVLMFLEDLVQRFGSSSEEVRNPRPSEDVLDLKGAEAQGVIHAPASTRTSGPVGERDGLVLEDLRSGMNDN